MEGGTYTETAGGSITETAQEDYNMYAGRNIISTAAKNIYEYGEEDGISFGDPKTPPALDIQAKCMVYFRPKAGWAGEDFGFDWFRNTDTGTYGDIKYEDNIGMHYLDAGYTQIITDLNAFTDSSGNIHFKKNDALLNNLKSIEYFSSSIVWKPQKDAAGKEMKDSKGKTIYERYYAAWLSLYPSHNEIKAGPPPLKNDIQGSPDAARVISRTPTNFTNTKAILSLYVEIEEAPDMIEFDENEYFSITPKQINLKGKGKGLHKMNDAVTIECTTEFTSDQTIYVNAKKKNADGTETVQLAGFIKVMANSTGYRKKKKVVLVKVILPPMSTVHSIPGNATGQKNLFGKYLKQALVNIEAVEETLNLLSDSAFKAGGTYENNGQILAYYDNNTHTPGGFISLEEHLYTKLQAQLKAANPKDENKYDKYFKAFYLGENGGVMEAGGVLQGLNGYSNGSDKLVLFPSKNDQTPAHEFLHTLNLPHSFSNPESSIYAKYTYHAIETDNLMDYSHQHHPPIVRKSLWHWQWVIANAAADPE